MAHILQRIVAGQQRKYKTIINLVGDVEKPLHIWADFIGIPPEALRRRLYDGWNVERALFEKIDTTKCPKKYRAALRREQDG